MRRKEDYNNTFSILHLLFKRTLSNEIYIEIGQANANHNNMVICLAVIPFVIFLYVIKYCAFFEITPVYLNKKRVSLSYSKLGKVHKNIRKALEKFIKTAIFDKKTCSLS